MIEQANKTGSTYDPLCRLFVLSQCAMTMTASDFLYFGQKQWVDVCLDFVHDPPDPENDPNGETLPKVTMYLLLYKKISGQL